jgi:hypothetical protein
MKKKLNPSVARAAARTPGPLSQIQAQVKTARSRRRATEESARSEKSFRIAMVSPTNRTAAG